MVCTWRPRCTGLSRCTRGRSVRRPAETALPRIAGSSPIETCSSPRIGRPPGGFLPPSRRRASSRRPSLSAFAVPGRFRCRTGGRPRSGFCPGRLKDLGNARPVVVVGGGFIGSHVAEALVARETPTVVLTRTAPRPEVCEALAGAELVIADAVEPNVLDDAVADARHVVFCAGALTPADSMASPV